LQSQGEAEFSKTSQSARNLWCGCSIWQGAFLSESFTSITFFSINYSSDYLKDISSNNKSDENAIGIYVGGETIPARRGVAKRLMTKLSIVSLMNF
jgi:hypothetical protein